MTYHKYIGHTGEGGRVGTPVPEYTAPVYTAPVVAQPISTQPVAQPISVQPEQGQPIISDTGQVVGYMPTAPVQPVGGIADLIQEQAEGYLGFDIPGLPGGEYSFGDILPGGAPFRFPDLPEGNIVRHWWTGTALFAISSLNKHWVLTKFGTWKKYRPGGAVVIGKELTPKNLNKAMRVMGRYKKLQKAIDKVFPKRRAAPRYAPPHKRSCGCK